MVCVRILHVPAWNFYVHQWEIIVGLICRDTRMSSVKACFEYYQDTGIKLGVIQKIIELAKQYEIEKVLLFGSRARGDYRSKSDIDLASTGGNFTRFSLDVDELTQTLLQFDIVNLDGPVQKELLESIQKEGIVIYEKV